MFCYVDRYFVILFRLLHFLFQRDLVSFHWFLNMTSFHRNRYTQIMYIYIYIYKITDYIICVYAVYMLMHTYTYMYVYMCVCVYIYICAVIPHTALLSHSELPQGKFLHRDSPISMFISHKEMFMFLVSVNSNNTGWLLSSTEVIASGVVYVIRRYTA